jgi:superfamily I DNA and/or RNA helicase
VAVTIVQCWVKKNMLINSGLKVFCGSDSNIAVDNLLEGLVKGGVNAVRVGRPESTSPHLLKYCVDEVAKTAFENALNSGKSPKDAKVIQFMVRDRLVRSADVVCATCLGASVGYLANFPFVNVLVDEASQAHELSSFVPVMHGCQQLVLVGDHCQLPPTISCEAAAADGLNVSLFDRLVRSGVKPFQLNVQYRMHPALSEFPSDCFYGGMVGDGVEGADRLPPRGVEWPVPGVGLCFLHVGGKEARDGESRVNEGEANMVVALVENLIAGGEVGVNDIGVVTPYNAQVRLLRAKLAHVRHGGWQVQQEYGRMQGALAQNRALQQRILTSMRGMSGGCGGDLSVLQEQQRALEDRMKGFQFNLEVNSVDGFQGREKAVIVFSAVRSNEWGNVGFLSDWRRTNVALTRAKRGLVVVGNGTTLCKEERSWRPFLEYVKEKGYFYRGSEANGSEASDGGLAGLAELAGYDRERVRGLGGERGEARRGEQSEGGKVIEDAMTTLTIDSSK